MAKPTPTMERVLKVLAQHDGPMHHIQVARWLDMHGAVCAGVLKAMVKRGLIVEYGGGKYAVPTRPMTEAVETVQWARHNTI